MKARIKERKNILEKKTGEYLMEMYWMEQRWQLKEKSKPEYLEKRSEKLKYISRAKVIR